MEVTVIQGDEGRGRGGHRAEIKLISATEGKTEAVGKPGLRLSETLLSSLQVRMLQLSEYLQLGGGGDRCKPSNGQAPALYWKPGVYFLLRRPLRTVSTLLSGHTVALEGRNGMGETSRASCSKPVPC